MSDPSAPDFAGLRRRIAARGARPDDAQARAAVAAILRGGRSGPEVLLIRRAESPADPWSGHMAFPGGRLEPTDPSLEYTAVRETAEEVGLHLPSYGELLGRLDDVPTHKAGLVVRPFVWAVGEPPALRPNHEVAAVHWVPIEPLIRGEHDTTYELEWKGAIHRFPGYRVRERIVWGLTYRMLRILFEHLDPLAGER